MGRKARSHLCHFRGFMVIFCFWGVSLCCPAYMHTRNLYLRIWIPAAPANGMRLFLDIHMVEPWS